MAAPPEVGVNIFFSEDTIRWILGGIVVVGAGIAGWVWNLERRMTRVESTLGGIGESIGHMDKDIDMVRNAVRSVGGALDHKLEEETDKLRSQVESLRDRLEEMKTELPSRSFIEIQLGGLTQRIDRMFDVKLAGR
jgi:hypothetical protein